MNVLSVIDLFHISSAPRNFIISSLQILFADGGFLFRRSNSQQLHPGIQHCYAFAHDL